MRTSGIIVIIIIALLAVLGITLGTEMVGDDNNHQNVSDMLPDNLESNNIIKMNDNGTYVVIDNDTHKVIHTATKNKTIVTPKNNSKDDTIELQTWESMRVDPSDNTAPNIKIDSLNITPDKLLSPEEIIKQYDLSADEILSMYIYVGTVDMSGDGNLLPFYEIISPFYSCAFDATTGECVSIHTIDNCFLYNITGDLDNEFNNFIKTDTDIVGVVEFYNQLADIAYQNLREANNLTNDYDVYIGIMNITNKGNGSTYTFISNVGNVTLDSDKNILNISAGGNDTTFDNFISKEEAINIVKPGVIKDIKEWHPEFVSRTTFSATGPQISQGFHTTEYEVETFIDGNYFMTTWIDARTGKILESVGIGDASSGIHEDGTWGPFSEEEYEKRSMMHVAHMELSEYCQNHNLPELDIVESGTYVNDNGEKVYQYNVVDGNKKWGTMEVNSITVNVIINIDSLSTETNETSIHADEDVGAYPDENNQTVEDNLT